jgi:anti-sigma factor RsiW
VTDQNAPDNSMDDGAIAALREGGKEQRGRLREMAAANPSLAGRLAEWDRQDDALRTLYGPVAHEPVPQRLLAATARPAAWRLPSLPPWLPQMAAAVALLAIGALAGWSGARLSAPPPAQMALASQALQAHSTFVVEVAHPVEVAASDEQHLTNWLSKRLGHKITPPDLAEFGFQLMGGRIVPQAEGAAAQMMYEDASGRRLTLYVAREPGSNETAFRFVEGDKADGFWWIDEGIGCAVFADLPREVLRSISVAAYEQLI